MRFFKAWFLENCFQNAPCGGGQAIRSNPARFCSQECLSARPESQGEFSDDHRKPVPQVGNNGLLPFTTARFASVVAQPQFSCVPARL